MSSSNGTKPTTVAWRGLVRTPENGSRRSRTLRLDDDSAQVQAKAATVTETHSGEQTRYLQVRYWTEETQRWTHQVIDPALCGIASIIAVGYGDTEGESWAMARKHVLDTYEVEL